MLYLILSYSKLSIVNNIMKCGPNIIYISESLYKTLKSPLSSIHDNSSLRFIFFYYLDLVNI